MTISFVLLVNKQGQTRLAKYTDQEMSVEEKRALEGEIVRKCLTRSEKQVRSPRGKPHSLLTMMSQCSFVEHRNYKVIYRRYASLFFLVGVDGDEVR